MEVRRTVVTGPPNSFKISVMNPLHINITNILKMKTIYKTKNLVRGVVLLYHLQICFMAG